MHLYVNSIVSSNYYYYIYDLLFLAGDDRRISAYNRGGPEKMQVTGWLQIMDIQKEHEGDYTCIAQNTLGMDKSVARLNVEEQVGENDWEDQNEGRNDMELWKGMRNSRLKCDS